MRSPWIVAAVIIAGICVYALAQNAEEPMEIAFPHGTISGIVTDSQSNMPVFGAKVEVTKDGFSFGLSAQTDRDGKYTIENVPVGVFDLSVSKGKYLPKVVSAINVKEGEAAANANIAIQPITPIQIGEGARNFSLTAISGKSVSLGEFKGKNIVLLSISSPYG